jgi:hypothetical protein
MTGLVATTVSVTSSTIAWLYRLRTWYTHCCPTASGRTGALAGALAVFAPKSGVVVQAISSDAHGTASQRFAVLATPVDPAVFAILNPSAFHPAQVATRYGATSAGGSERSICSEKAALSSRQTR